MSAPAELGYTINGREVSREEWLAAGDDARSEPCAPIASGPGRCWSPMQGAVFEAVEDPAGRHVVVEALAGSGKSTTIVEAVCRTPPDASVIVMAFNKAIVTALIPKVPRDVVVQSFHSYGLRTISAAHGKREVDPLWVSEGLKEILGDGWGTFDARRAAQRVVSIAKGSLISHTDLEALDEAADAFGVEFPTTWDRGRIIEAAAASLRQAFEASQGPIDYDDMIWLPVVRHLPTPTYDFVFVDETQDLNPTQLALAQGAARNGGRIVAVGDRHQAIYGFRGADREAIPRMIHELRAKVLPLSITYRCPRAVVAEAQEIVPALEAAPSAAEGIVRTVGDDVMRRDVAPGDVVISRTNAPLVAWAFKWIAEGRRVTIAGRDIGKGLVTWIKASRAQSIEALVRKINTWHASEVRRLVAAERPTEAVDDKAACLLALTEGATTVPDVIARCEALFADAPNGAAGRILLTSTHRSKGLEWERVWLLRDTFCKWPGDEEDNLLYVAITRAKHELIYVHETKSEAS